MYNDEGTINLLKNIYFDEERLEYFKGNREMLQKSLANQLTLSKPEQKGVQDLKIENNFFNIFENNIFSL